MTQNVPRTESGIDRHLARFPKDQMSYENGFLAAKAGKVKASKNPYYEAGYKDGRNPHLAPIAT